MRMFYSGSVVAGRPKLGIVKKCVVGNVASFLILNEFYRLSVNQISG